MKEKLKLILKKKRVIIPFAAVVIVGISNLAGHPIDQQAIEEFLNAFANLFQ